VAGGMGPGPGGNRKGGALNLNLVPFVDLFSVLIIFLVSTAVWDQIASVQINLGVENKPSTQVAPPDTVKKIQANIKITVASDYIEFFDEGRTKRLPKGATGFDFAAVDDFVTGVRSKYPEKKDMLIMAGDKTVYENLIGVMDKCLAKQFDQLIVTGTEAQL
jgi:biopolymer transport protein ExbD